jgi:hypothetical protein
VSEECECTCFTTAIYYCYFLPLFTNVIYYCYLLLNQLSGDILTPTSVYCLRYCYVCFLILLCPHTSTTYVSSYYYSGSYYYVSSYDYYICSPTTAQAHTRMCPQTITTCVLLLLFRRHSSRQHRHIYFYVCVLILLCMCPHTSIYMSSYFYIRASHYYYMYPHTTTTYVSSPYYATYVSSTTTCVLTLLLHMCPDPITHMCPLLHVSSHCYYMCPDPITHMCPHPTAYVSSGDIRLDCTDTLADAGSNGGLANRFWGSDLKKVDACGPHSACADKVQKKKC